MLIEDCGIIVGVRDFEEKYCIVECFLKEHGLMRGVIRKSKQTSAICLPGNLVESCWFARTRDQLGSYKFELNFNVVAAIVFDRVAVSIVHSALSMLQVILQEKEPQASLFLVAEKLLVLAIDYEIGALLRLYLIFELHLLKAAGFGLSLEKCVVTGSQEELDYISPKSGAAVCREFGLPYRERILALPKAILDQKAPLTLDEFCDCLAITTFFIERNILTAYQKKMPYQRGMMIEAISARQEKSIAN